MTEFLIKHDTKNYQFLHYAVVNGHETFGNWPINDRKLLPFLDDVIARIKQQNETIAKKFPTPGLVNAEQEINNKIAEGWLTVEQITNKLKEATCLDLK